jgi:hypothetical protein
VLSSCSSAADFEVSLESFLKEVLGNNHTLSLVLSNVERVREQSWIKMYYVYSVMVL